MMESIFIIFFIAFLSGIAGGIIGGFLFVLIPLMASESESVEW